MHDVILFEDIGNGQTKLTFIGNETMENAKNSGQLEGWNQMDGAVAGEEESSSRNSLAG